jgi:hypothetical protein
MGGIRAWLQALGLVRHDDGTIAGKLTWQAKVEGDAAQVAAFKEQALGLMAFRGFAFMKPKPPVIQVAHSLGMYFGMSGRSPKLQDRQVAFSGDRGPGRLPFPVLLPPNNSWSWVKARAYFNTVTFTEFYEDEASGNQMWTPGVAATLW